MATNYRSYTLRPPSHNALVVRTVPEVTPEDREKILEDVGYNIFAYPAGLVTCDFLSDSGTSAMMDVQWAALMRGNESYGRNWGYYCLLDAFRDIFERGKNHQRIFDKIVAGPLDADYYRSTVLVPHQGGLVNGGRHQLERPNFFIAPKGRCAKNFLFSAMSGVIAQGTSKTSYAIISNGFLDTTGAHAEKAGFKLQTLIQPGLNEPFPEHLIGKRNPFKGNLDVTAAEAYIKSNPDKVAMVLTTITNNWAAGQPVSMENIRNTAAVAKRHGIPFFFDACRFAENAFFIHEYEHGYADKSIPEIVQEMFSYVDGFTISLKKNGLANMGGVLCFRDQGAFAKKYPFAGEQIKERQILTYGNDSCGAMSGRDLMAAVCGLYEIVKPTYLRHRIKQVQSFAQKLQAVGISVLSPSGGHAVYLDVDDFFFGCNRKPDDFAGVGLTIELLRNYGIRAAESGPYSWKCDRISQKERSKILNLVRFAVPRHTMSSEHIDYTVAAVKELHNRRHTIPTMEIVRGVDMKLRHFAASLKPVPVDTTISATHTDEASRQLALLGEAVGSSSAENDQLIEAFKLAAGEYGDAPVVKKRSDLKWLSDVSNDHAFLEYSVQIDQETGEAVLRFLIEAQPQEEPCAGCLRPMSHDKPHDLMLMDLGKSAMALTTVLAEKHPSAVSLDRMKAIEDLFVPEVPEGKFAAFHSCVSTKHGPEWKIYLNPSAKGSQNAVANTRETFERLGLAESWKLVESTLDENDAIAYFSLDLAPDLEHSRVKLYIAHRNVTAAKVADKHTKICPGADSYTIQQFCALMAGGSIGPYKSKSMISCFAFTSEMPLKPAGTVHFPSSEYAENDAIVQERMEKYIEVADISDAYRERYRKCVRAVQRRPLDQGRGIHAWISLKQSVKGKKSTTFYLSAELYGPLDESGYVMVDQAGA